MLTPLFHVSQNFVRATSKPMPKANAPVKIVDTKTPKGWDIKMRLEDGKYIRVGLTVPLNDGVVESGGKLCPLSQYAKQSVDS